MEIMKFLVIYCPECKTLLGELRLTNESLYCKKCNIIVNSHGEINEIFKKCLKCGRKVEQFFRKNVEGSYVTNYNNETFCYPCWAKDHNIAGYVGITDYLKQNLKIWR